jgi:hypothetical protein
VRIQARLWSGPVPCSGPSPRGTCRWQATTARPPGPLRPPVTVASAGDLTPAAAVTAPPGGPAMAGKHAGPSLKRARPTGLAPEGGRVGPSGTRGRGDGRFHLPPPALDLAAVTAQRRLRPLRTARLDPRLQRVLTGPAVLPPGPQDGTGARRRRCRLRARACCSACEGTYQPGPGRVSRNDREGCAGLSGQVSRPVSVRPGA